MLTLFLAALFLGFIFNATPGVIFAETIRQGAKSGFKAALAVQIGSLVGDALWAVIGLVGVGLILQLNFLRLLVGTAGVLYLLWLAWNAWQDASNEFSIQSEQTITHSKDAFRFGMLLSVTNPHNLAYWAALGSAMSVVGVDNPTTVDYLIFFTGFMVSSILWSFICAGLVAKVFQKAEMYWKSITYRICAITFLILGLFSVQNIWSSYFAPHNYM